MSTELSDLQRTVRFSQGQKILGLLTATIIGWAGSVAIMLFIPVIEHMVAAPLLGRQYKPTDDLASLTNLVVVLAIFGIPIAGLVTFSLGFPVWKIAEKRGFNTKAQALKYGMYLGAVIWSLSILISLFFGLQTALDPNASSETRWWGYKTSDDGLPTLLGWAFAVKNLLYTLLVGALAGLCARLVAGKPKIVND